MRATFSRIRPSVLLLVSVFQVTCIAQSTASPKAYPDLPAQYATTAFGQSGSVAGKSFASQFMCRK
jgi:hypothetical protein